MKILVFILCILNFNARGQNLKSFTIHGELNGLKDNTVLYLERNNDNGGSDTVGKTAAKDGKFFFTGIAIEAEPFFIKIDTTKTKYPKKIRGQITILMENKNVQIKGDIDDLSIPGIQITGCQSHNEFLDYYRQSDSLMNISNGFLDQINKANGKGDSISAAYFQKQYDQARFDFNNDMRKWIDNHPNSMVTPWLVTIIYRDDLSPAEECFSHLSQRSRDSKFGKELAAQIATLKKTALGRIAPDFRLPDSNGKSISLQEVLVKSKFTILEFWASWCAPCLDELPNMKKIYAGYHAKGLNILSYSVDEKEIEWKKALAKNDLPWFNVRETAKSFAEKIYGVVELPQTYLLDSKGQILAKGLIGDALEKKIEELINQ